MTVKTRPLSIRLAESDIEKLSFRARRMSGTPTGIARELILSGLADGDPYTQAERLLKIERRLAVLSQDLSAASTTVDKQTGSLGRIESMFEQLLLALSGQTAA
ncbi:MAG: hypothetical protein ABJL57_03160 [Hyphomonas sp.]|uniref:hypothetical protein n=1 Tax=Hyphomonas sp. TaxID=87 RepID=UPI0032657088